MGKALSGELSCTRTGHVIVSIKIGLGLGQSTRMVM